jgi:RNA polymerase sigma factor (sigma-70 family)
MTKNIPENRMDADAFQEPIDENGFVSEVCRLAYRFARRLTCDDDAEDIAQEVALKCLLRLRSRRWRSDQSPDALVAHITRRTYANRMRADARRRSRDAQYLAERTAVAPGWMNPARPSEEWQESQLYERALEELPEASRSTFLLVRDCGMTYRDAALHQGIALSIVAKRVARAEGFLADRLLDTRRWQGMPPSMERQSRAQQRNARS